MDENWFLTVSDSGHTNIKLHRDVYISSTIQTFDVLSPSLPENTQNAGTPSIQQMYFTVLHGCWMFYYTPPPLLKHKTRKNLAPHFSPH